MPNHEYFMQQVLKLAQLTPLQTRPNPQVAAILVKNQQIVGIGCHLFAGGPHAEIHALQQAQERALGATLYINLEPCCHVGRTGPCADALIAAGVSSVFVANLDPNPLVAGKGVARLRAAGIKVQIGLLADEASKINSVFYHNIQTQTPYVTLKAGLSLDGRIATKNNLSQWITSPESRTDAHGYRISHEAILVGVNTVISDNPSLTPHLIDNHLRTPIRIILDRQLRTPLTAKVVTDHHAPTWICTTSTDTARQQEYIQRGVKILHFPDLNIDNLLRRLYQENIYSLLLEGGERIYSSFLDAKAVNQLVCYYSPQVIGSLHAKHLFAGIGFANLESNLHFKLEEVRQIATDVKMVFSNHPSITTSSEEPASCWS